MAFNMITNLNETVAVCTDLLVPIRSINNMYKQNHLVLDIHETCHLVAIIWVPLHVAVAGNVRTYHAAQQASTSDLLLEEIQLHKNLKNL